MMRPLCGMRLFLTEESPTKTNKEQTRPTKTNNDQPRPTNNKQDQPRPTKTNKDQPTPTKTWRNPALGAPNCPVMFRTLIWRITLSLLMPNLHKLIPPKSVLCRESLLNARWHLTNWGSRRQWIFLKRKTFYPKHLPALALVLNRGVQIDSLETGLNMIDDGDDDAVDDNDSVMMMMMMRNDEEWGWWWWWWWWGWWWWWWWWCMEAVSALQWLSMVACQTNPCPFSSSSYSILFFVVSLF